MKIFASVVLAVAVATALSACGNGKGDKPVTQMAARVNSDEVTVHQVNAVLGRATGITPANVAQAKKEILERLIDQQLAVQQAEEKKLDRTPAVVQSLDAARREILARAYLEQLGAGQAKPSADEVKRYYAEHPELFAQRRIYNLQELLVPADGALVEEIKAWANQGKTMQEIGNALKARDIHFKANAVVRPAEQLPLEMLPRFHALKDGDTVVFQNAQALTVLHLVAAQSSPVDEAAAQPLVEQYLLQRRSAELATAAIKSLRDKAKIERMGEFASGAEAAPVASTAPTAPAAPAASTPAAAPSVNLDKGVAGFK